MSPGYSMLGFVVIMILYAVIGLMAAAGTIFTVRKFLGPRAEQVFYGMFLIMIAAFYLAFAAYFGIATALRAETAAVVIFAVPHGGGSSNRADAAAARIEELDFIDSVAERRGIVYAVAIRCDDALRRAQVRGAYGARRE